MRNFFRNNLANYRFPIPVLSVIYNLRAWMWKVQIAVQRQQELWQYFRLLHPWARPASVPSFLRKFCRKPNNPDTWNSSATRVLSC